MKELSPTIQDSAIRRILADNNPAAAMQLIALKLQEFAPRVIPLARKLLEDPEQLCAIARRSYSHANGFAKIVLAASDAYKLRLHVWLPGAHAEENAHEHRWHFASAILAGVLHSEIFLEAADLSASLYDELLYQARSDEVQAVAIPNGQTKLVRVGSVTYRAGDAYTMAPGVIHRVSGCGSDLTATLMLQACAARTWNRMFPRAGVVPVVAQRPMSPLQLRRVLIDFLDLSSSERLAVAESEGQ